MDAVDLTITAMQVDDWQAVRAVYLEGIATSAATFETAAPSWDSWNASHLPCCRLVAWLDGQLAGWAALAPVSSRVAYAGVAEISIYITAAARSQGVGKALLAALIDASEKAGLWTLQATILAENCASLGLHRSFGFREVGRRERIAQLNGAWRDTIILERRSRVVGI